MSSSGMTMAASHLQLTFERLALLWEMPATLLFMPILFPDHQRLLRLDRI